MLVYTCVPIYYTRSCLYTHFHYFLIHDQSPGAVVLSYTSVLPYTIALYLQMTILLIHLVYTTLLVCMYIHHLVPLYTLLSAAPSHITVLPYTYLYDDIYTISVIYTYCLLATVQSYILAVELYILFRHCFGNFLHLSYYFCIFVSKV